MALHSSGGTSSIHSGVGRAGRVAVALVTAFATIFISVATAIPAAPAAQPPFTESPAPAPSAEALTGPVGTIPDGAFPNGTTAVAQFPELRTATSNTYLTSTGSRVLLSYPGPVNYEDSSGAYQPIDDTAVTNADGGWSNQANSYVANVPSTLAQPVSITSAGNSVSFTMQSASSSSSQAAPVSPSGVSASASGNRVTFADPVPHTNVSYAFGNTGVEEALTLDSSSAPDTYTWSIDPSSDLTAQMTGSGSIQFTNPFGVVVMTIDTPSIKDNNDTVGPQPSLSLAPDGSSMTLSLAPDAAWLSDPSRAFPVTVDPTVSVAESGSECQLFQDSATTSHCGSTTTYAIGSTTGNGNEHTMFRFDNLASDIPYDSLVQNANFAVYEQGASTSTSIPITLSTVNSNRAWTTGATWNDYDGTHAWTTGGGDYTTTTETNTVSAGTANGWIAFDPVQQVQNWVNGEDLTQSTPPAVTNEGFMLTATNGAANSISVTNWQSSTTSQWPYLSVMYTPRIGTGSGLNIIKTALNDKTTLGVNPGNGDLSVDTSLFNIPGIGQNLTIDQNYDSQGAPSSSMGSQSAGAPWSLTPSLDQPRLIVQATSPGVTDLVSDDGTNAVFLNGNSSGVYSASPPGLAATANVTATAASVTFNQSGLVWNFLPVSTGSSTYYLSTSVDRNGNTITYNYNTGITELTSISGTEGQTLTIGYNTAGEVSSITDGASREITYSYNCACGGSTRLVSATYGGLTTYYGYDTNGNLHTLNDPLGNIVAIDYNSSHQVTSVTRVINYSTLTGDTTNYSYSPGSASSPTSGVTTVTDPDSNASSYYYDPADRVTKVTDALGHSESSSYNPVSSPTQLQNGLTQATNLTYDTNNNLDEITSPPTASGQTPASTSLKYNTPTTGSGAVTGGTYLPSSSTDAQTNCNSFIYDSHGNEEGSYTGFAPGTNCDGMTSGTGVTSVKNAYQGDGTTTCGGKPGELCSTTSGNGNVTNYAYNTTGQLTSVTQPGGSCSGTRKLCTTITYDSLGRVSTVTDGKNQTDTYSYDDWDRITQILYNGTSTCSTSAGTCVQFVYDGDGNVTSRVDQTGTTIFIYDTLNRLVQEDLPSSVDACSGYGGMRYTYDAASNLVSNCDAGGTVSYVYDAANRNTGEATDGGSCTPGAIVQPCTTFGYDAANNLTSITYPSSTSVTDSLGYDGAGHQTSELVKEGTTTLGSMTYTYNNSTTDRQLQQTADNLVSGIDTTYSYDSQNRLTGAAETGTGATSSTYSYDADSNMTQKTIGSTTDTYAYNSSDQLCWGVSGTSSNTCSSPPTGSTTYSYDADGNQTGSSAGESISYNSLNQTTSLTPAGGSAQSMTYTGTDSTERTSVGSTTFANGLQGIAESTTGGTATYFARTPSGRLTSIKVGSARYYVYYNGAGSIGGMFTSSGVGDANYTYGPDGGTVTSGTEATANPFRYMGGYQDTSSYYKFGTRFYFPQLVAWTQEDPMSGTIQNPSTVNRYPYAGDDPVNNVDPGGMSIFGDIVGAVSVAVGVASIVSLAFIPEVTIPIGLLAAIGGDTSIAGGVYSLLGGT
jgi:RHS repeat-associated protein